jgi:hypothetical protein
MPIHDWTRVSAGTWHAFHLSWISEIQLVRNESVLPADYYAQAEQIAGPLGPDVLTLQMPATPSAGTADSLTSGGAVAVSVLPSPMRLTAEAAMDDYFLKRRTLVIRHGSGDRIVALLEMVSLGNKSSRHGLRSFIEKAVEALYRGYHLLIVDLFPPSRRDPQGIHGVIWAELCDDPLVLPADEPLTLGVLGRSTQASLRRAHGRGALAARHAPVSGAGALRECAA